MCFTHNYDEFKTQPDWMVYTFDEKEPVNGVS